MWSPVPRKENSRKQHRSPCWRGPGARVSQQTRQEPAACPGSREAHQHPGLYEQEPNQPTKGSDHPTLTSTHRPHQDSASSFGSPSPERTLINQSEFGKRPPRQLGLEHLPCGEGLRKQDWLSLEQRHFGRAQQQPHHDHHLWRGHQKEEARLSSAEWEEKDTKTETREVLTGPKEKLLQREARPEQPAPDPQAGPAHSRSSD